MKGRVWNKNESHSFLTSISFLRFQTSSSSYLKWRKKNPLNFANRSGSILLRPRTVLARNLILCWILICIKEKNLYPKNTKVSLYMALIGVKELSIPKGFEAFCKKKISTNFLQLLFYQHTNAVTYNYYWYSYNCTAYIYFKVEIIIRLFLNMT